MRSLKGFISIFIILSIVALSSLAFFSVSQAQATTTAELQAQAIKGEQARLQAQAIFELKKMSNDELDRELRQYAILLENLKQGLHKAKNENPRSEFIKIATLSSFTASATGAAVFVAGQTITKDTVSRLGQLIGYRAKVFGSIVMLTGLGVGLASAGTMALDALIFTRAEAALLEKEIQATEDKIRIIQSALTE